MADEDANYTAYIDYIYDYDFVDFGSSGDGDIYDMDRENYTSTLDTDADTVSETETSNFSDCFYSSIMRCESLEEKLVIWITSAFILVVILFAISSAILVCVRCRKEKRRKKREEEVGAERVFSFKWQSFVSLSGLNGEVHSNSRNPTAGTIKSTSPLIP